QEVGVARTDDVADDGAVAERLDRRDAGDGVALGRDRVVVGVDLHQDGGVAEPGDLALEHRPEDTARPAPRRPEVHDDRDLLRALEHRGLEVGIGHVQAGSMAPGAAKGSTAARAAATQRSSSPTGATQASASSAAARPASRQRTHAASSADDRQPPALATLPAAWNERSRTRSP